MPGKNVISELDYKDAVSLIDSKIIEKNHSILDSTVDDIEDSKLICKIPEIELFQMRTEIFYLIPDFLKSPNDPKLKGLKQDIELYKNLYEKLAEKLNVFIDEASESLKNLLEPSNKLEMEIMKIIAQFEETVKNLCAPLISEQQGLDTIDTNKLSERQKDELNEEKSDIVYKIDLFKKESKELNKQYNSLFKEINKYVQELCDTIKEIPSTLTNIQDKIEEGMSNYEEILEEFTDLDDFDNFQNLLIKIKESVDLLNNEIENIIKHINEKISNLSIQFKNKEDSFSSLKVKSKNTIESLKSRSNNIKNDILELRNKYKQKEIELPEMYISNLIINISKPLEESLECINNINISEGIKDIQIIIKNSLPTMDLLFMMDITGSMERYLEITKQKLIDIMDIIKKKCSGIDINLGFIAYKDVAEIEAKDFRVIPFTKNHKYVEEQIKKLEVGGGDDTAEHVSWAFSKAIKEEWSSNSRCAVLITDAPCHGLKYHDKKLMDAYPQGVPGEENIEMLANEMGKNEISLICIKLKDDTDIMYKIFKEIYKDKKNCIFDIVPIKSPELLAKIIPQNAIQNYREQQFNKI